MYIKFHIHIAYILECRDRPNIYICKFYVHVVYIYKDIHIHTCTYSDLVYGEHITKEMGGRKKKATLKRGVMELLTN